MNTSFGFRREARAALAGKRGTMALATLARGVLPLIFPVLLLVLVCSRVAVPALLWILLILSLAGLLCLTGPLTMGSCAMSLAALRGGRRGGAFFARLAAVTEKKKRGARFAKRAPLLSVSEKASGSPDPRR